MPLHDVGQVTMHLTNYSLNKRSADFDHGLLLLGCCLRMRVCVRTALVVATAGSADDFSVGTKRTITAAFAGALEDCCLCARVFLLHYRDRR